MDSESRKKVLSVFGNEVVGVSRFSNEVIGVLASESFKYFLVRFDSIQINSYIK